MLGPCPMHQKQDPQCREKIGSWSSFGLSWSMGDEAGRSSRQTLAHGFMPAVSAGAQRRKASAAAPAQLPRLPCYGGALCSFRARNGPCIVTASSTERHTKLQIAHAVNLGSVNALYVRVSCLQFECQATSLSEPTLGFWGECPCLQCHKQREKLQQHGSARSHCVIIASSISRLSVWVEWPLRHLPLCMRCVPVATKQSQKKTPNSKGSQRGFLDVDSISVVSLMQSYSSLNTCSVGEVAPPDLGLKVCAKRGLGSLIIVLVVRQSSVRKKHP